MNNINEPGDNSANDSAADTNSTDEQAGNTAAGAATTSRLGGNRFNGTAGTVIQVEADVVNLSF